MTFGTCRYCGQVVNLDYEEETQAEADIAASEFARFSGTMLQSWALPRLLPKNRCNS